MFQPIVTPIKNSYRESVSYIVEICESKIVVFDPSDASAAIIDWLQDHQCTLEAIFITHEHPDHCLGVDFLYEEYKSPIYSSAVCEKNMREPKLNYSYYSTEIQKFGVKSPVNILNDTGVISIMGCEVKFMASPGHSPGSMVFNIANNWFTGDTILEGKTALGLPHSSLTDYKISIMKFLTKAKEGDNLHPGHGLVFRYHMQVFLFVIAGSSQKLKNLFEL